MTTLFVSVRRVRRVFPVLRRPFSDHNSEFFADLNDELGAEGSHYFQKDYNSTYKVQIHQCELLPSSLYIVILT